MKRLFNSLIPAITWFILSTILLVLPGSSFPTESWYDWVHLDKWIHIGMFGLMVLLWCIGTRRYIRLSKVRSRFALIAICALSYGIAMEFVQKYFVPNRSFDVWDIAADATGCMIGLLIATARSSKKN